MPAIKKTKRKSTLGRVDAAAKRQQSGNKKWLKIPDGESVVIRVLDTGDDFKDAYVHNVPFESEDGKSTYYLDVPCLDQEEKGDPCPGCRDDVDRRYKFWTNVIARDWEDEDGGKPTDTLMILSGGITLAKMLDKKDQRFGLENRDIEIEREGKRFDTKYTVEWADEETTPLTTADKKLAEKKHDLTRYSKPPSFDDFYVPPRERDKDDDDGDVGERSRKRGSAFRSEKKTGSRAGGKKTTAKGGLAAMKARKKGDEAKKATSKKTIVRRRAR